MEGRFTIPCYDNMRSAASDLYFTFLFGSSSITGIIAMFGWELDYFELKKKILHLIFQKKKQFVHIERTSEKRAKWKYYLFRGLKFSG